MEKSMVSQRIQQLRGEILQYNNRYYNQDSPEISDAAYDELATELRDLKQENIRSFQMTIRLQST